jgi:hypothetical protein
MNVDVHLMKDEVGDLPAVINKWKSCFNEQLNSYAGDECRDFED